jgi:RecA-family ATPase
VVTVKGYVDASHAVHKDLKSQSGCSISLGIGSVFVSSKKQKTVAKSSTEAEIIALSDNVGMVLSLREFLEELGVQVSEAIIYQDNTSAICMANSGVAKGDTLRHIRIRLAQLKELLGDEGNKLRLEYLPTEDMVADILTKAIHGDLLKRLSEQLLGIAS